MLSVAGANNCLSFLMLTTLVVFMAPKKKDQATEKPIPKKKRGRNETDEEAEKPLDISLVKVEKNAKGEYPAIPPDELNKLNSRLNHAKASGNPQLFDEFRAMNRIEKRVWFWDVYRFGKDILYAKRSEISKSSTTSTVGKVHGMITKYKVAELNGILPGVQGYNDMVAALVADLESVPHPNKALADLGERLYNYTHEKMNEAVEVEDRSSALEVKVDVAPTSVRQAASDMGIHFPASSSTDVIISEWKQTWLDELFEAEKETNKNKKVLDEADAFLYKLKLDVDNKLFQVMIPEATDKCEGFAKLCKAYNQTLVDLNAACSTAEGSVASIQSLKETKEKLLQVRKDFKTYLAKVRAFTGL